MKLSKQSLFVCLVALGCATRESPVTPNETPDVMVRIPAGTFRIGNITINAFGFSDELPVHEVTLSIPLLWCRTEVTQAQWRAVMGNNPSVNKGDSLPVETVSWYDAVAFCNRLSLLEGLDTCYSGTGAFTACDFSKNGYRLPTEAEWEYACRARTETDFNTGNMRYNGSTKLDTALDRAGWYPGNSGIKTQPVGRKQPNVFGLYDMHGNVDEWCWDWYSITTYTATSSTDPCGPTTGARRVLRGGSIGTLPQFCRSASRKYFWPTHWGGSIGFRVVRKM